MLLKPSSYRQPSFFVLLLIGLLGSVSAAKGQSSVSSPADLVGTYWTTPKLPVPSTTGSLIYRSRHYEFYANEKVIENYAQSVEYAPAPPVEYEDEVFSEMGADGVMKISTRRVPKKQWFNPYKEPNDFHSTPGTFKITGKALVLSFPGYSVRATIYENSISGTMTESGHAPEFWTISRETWSSSSTKSSPANDPAMALSASIPLSDAILRKYDPTRLTSNTIKGLINTTNGFFTTDRKKYYSFWAGPGEVKITTILTSLRNDYSSDATLLHALYFDSLGFAMPAGSGLTYATGGQTKTTETKISLESRKELLLELNENGRGTRFSIQIDGATDLNH